MKPVVLSLCSGVGGLDLGLERSGMHIAMQCEINEHRSSILQKRFPLTPRWEDITTLTPSHVRTRIGQPDIICGGYPCQPFSLAGKRQGHTDERNLWPDVWRLIRDLRPPFAILENVAGHLSLGFSRVLGDLAEIGYDAEWKVFSAAELGARHLRYRLWVVAYPQSMGWHATTPETQFGEGPEVALALCGASTTPHTHSQRQPRPGQYRAAICQGPHRQRSDGPSLHGTQPRIWPHQPGMGGALHGLSAWLDGLRRDNPWRPGWDQGIPSKRKGVPNGQKRLTALGLAVVPQCAELVGRAVMDCIEREASDSQERIVA